MNPTVALSLLSAVGFVTSVILLLRKPARRKLPPGALVPLLVTVLLYAFIVTSNFLEHSRITSFFDPLEDMAEIIFTLTFLFFAYNWRKHASFEIIRDKETWFRSALESSADGIITTDREGYILQMNRAMEDFTGCPQNEALGRKADLLLSFLDKNTREPIEYNPFSDILENKYHKSYPQGIILMSRHGEGTHVADSTSLIESPSHKVLGAVGIFRDMSKYESLMEQLTHTHKMEAIGQLAGGVAHDLNNMLGGIMGAADVMKTRLSREGITKYDKMISIILNSAENARDLTANLLAFSRRGKILSTPISVQEVIQKTVALAERTIDKLITLHTDCPPEKIMIIGDPSQLQNALLNLILNARDAMPEGGSILVSIEREYLDETWCEKSPFTVTPGDYIAINVEDSGIGIPMENQAKIFDPFFTTKEEGKGTGLGLSAVYGTVINHHGAITLKSDPDRGSTFTLHLPVTHADEAEQSEEEPAPQKGKGTILLIEDEDMLRSSTKMLLEDSGFHAITASSGREGINEYKINRYEIDLVILDMIMPGMNGREVFSVLREINPEVRVIMTSGFTNEENIPREVFAFIKKPFKLNELLSVINRALQ